MLLPFGRQRFGDWGTPHPKLLGFFGNLVLKALGHRAPKFESVGACLELPMEVYCLLGFRVSGCLLSRLSQNCGLFFLWVCVGGSMSRIVFLCWGSHGFAARFF